MVASPVWFGVGAATFALGIVAFVAFAVLRGDIRSPYYILPPIHSAIAGGAYVLMALVAAGLLPVFEIDLVRYADWSLSTPIITYYLSMLADADTKVRVGAVVTNVLMIAVGYVSTLLTGPPKWALFALSSLLFLGLVYVYFSTLTRAVEENPASSEGLFRSLRDLTIVVWTLYPVVYLLGPNGFTILTVADHTFVTMFLDLTAKVGFMAVMLTRQYELNTFIADDTTASPS